VSLKKNANKIMYDEFSWPAYLLSQPQAFSQWVDAGRKPPLHREFAQYLSWAVERSKAEVVTAEVSRLSLDSQGSKWQVWKKGSSGDHFASRRTFDGVVVSSPGPDKKLTLSEPSALVFTGQDFWRRTRDLQAIFNEHRNDEKKSKTAFEIAIIGAGGTAAAIWAWLTRSGFRDVRISLVAPQAALFTRGDSVFENRLFSDETLWRRLSPESQEAFFRRLNRGVVWATVMDQVETATALNFVDGRVETIQVNPRVDVPLQLDVVRDGKSIMRLNPSVVIDSSGFNEWWFLDLLDGIGKRQKESKKFQDNLRSKMNEELQFAPMLSSKIGPGLGSLMTMGACRTVYSAPTLDHSRWL
jgi:mycobactin lysine-N-oxygenase